MHPAAASGQDKKNNCTSHNDAAFVAALSRNASSAVLAVLLGAAWAVFRVYNVHQQRQSRHETKSADRRSPANAPIATRGSHDKPTQRQARRESPQVIGSHKTVHVTLMQDCAFRAMSQLNSAEGRAFAGKKHRLCLVDPAGCALPGPRDLGTPRAPVASDQQQQQSDVSRWFGGTSLTDRLAQALAARNAMDVKEFAESMEFFHKVRSHLKSSAVIVDLCCGHGFTGLLFAVFLKGVSGVYLVDRTKPPSFAAIFDAVVQVAPWIREKVTFVEADLSTMLEWSRNRTQGPASPQVHAKMPVDTTTASIGGTTGPCVSAASKTSHELNKIPQGASFLSVHACNKATDLSIDIAVNLAARAIACMPCCYYSEPVLGAQAPVLKQVFGKDLAIDMARTQLLHDAGYDVSWKVIPVAVTPKNRIIVAKQNNRNQQGKLSTGESKKARRKREWKEKKRQAKSAARLSRQPAALTSTKAEDHASAAPGR